jgi:hypothetical protein
MPTTNPWEQTLRKPPSQNRFKCTTPLGSRPKSKMNAGGSAMSRSATISHSPPHRTSKTASPSRGPGLTVRIEHDMMANIGQSIQSAPPARTIRRLPVPPLSSTPSTAPPKYFSDASLNPNNSLTPKRTPRAPWSKDHTYCFNATPEVSPPTACPPCASLGPCRRLRRKSILCLSISIILFSRGLTLFDILLVSQRPPPNFQPGPRTGNVAATLLSSRSSRSTRTRNFEN